jgi:hypothetical protein
MRARRLAAGLALIALGLPGTASAHVGSPQVTAAGSAGPYRLSVMISPPPVAPGMAQVQVDQVDARDDEIREVRLSVSPVGATSPRDVAVPAIRRSALAGAPRFSAEVWVASPGPWRLDVVAAGPAGAGELSVVVPHARRVSAAVRVSLIALRIVLALLLAALMGGTAALRRHTVSTVLATVVFVAVAVKLGGVPPATCAPGTLDASVVGGQLNLRFPKPALGCGGDAGRFLPDHGHVMHLFLVRLPGLDRVLHLHPRQIDGRFVQDVPEGAEGRYQAFADVVDATGVPATVLGEVTLPAAPGARLAGDDAAGEGPSIEAADLLRTTAPLSSGARLVWERGAAPLRTAELAMFTFHVEDAAGRPTADLQPYMGMLGHAVFLRHDRAVFAHVHPTGSVPMAASAALVGGQGAPHDACPMPEHASSSVTFPYGFPSPGTYRVFVQIKRNDRIETAVFDAAVER